MIWIILAALCSAIMDLVSSQDRFAKYGIWFSRDFTDLFHTSKTLMVAFFCIAAFSLTSQAFLAWLVFGVMFNFFYYLIK